MAKFQLLDQFGVPVSSSVLTEERAVPSVTGIEHPFDAVVASFLHPARLARTLRESGRGEMHDFLTLAEEIEEREPHYRYVIETRRNAVTSLNVQVDPASEARRDVEIADFLRDEIVETPAFQTLPDFLVDGLSKGYSVVEVVWEVGSAWIPKRFVWRDPRLFQWDRATRKELRLRVQGVDDGVALEPLKYLVHVPLLKMGLPARNGLARVGAWSFMLKSFSLKDWATFLEIYGMPLRLGKYGPSSSADDRKVLLAAVRDLGRDAAAIVPQGMEIEFVEAKGFSDKPFESNVRFIDEQVSKAVIGKPGDGAGSSKAGEEVLDRVRVDIKKADARDLSLTLMEQMIRTTVDANFGPQKRYPKVHFPIPERKDLQVWANAVAQLVDRGLEVEQSQVYDVIGLKEPATREGGSPVKLLKVPAAGGPAPKPPPQVPVEKASAWRLDPRVCPSCGPARLAADDPEQDDIDRLVAAALDDWQPDMGPIVEAIQAAAAASASYEEFQQALERLAADLPVGALAEQIASLNMIGRG
ncbi:Mu-like prophage protein gp29, partial [Bosea sp. CRIB-10]|uniref:phage portal protein family protein n=1 Tax=Bosea sp. CRIB-10 TaxID=378404 RepID=UPI0008E8219A